MTTQAHIFVHMPSGECIATFEMEVNFSQAENECYRPRIRLLYLRMMNHVGKVIVKFNTDKP